MAVTATATRRVQESIARNLGMRDPQILVGGFNRPNLHYSVKRCKNDNERETLLWRALPKLIQMGGSGLIYAPTRKLCESFGEIANRALAPLGKRAGIYHAGLEPHLRNAMQEGWLRGEIHTLVATNAFGMGIDKPDVRFVVHVCYPDSPESYYQEAGRAGRDGFKSRCVILSSGGDRRLREYFIENDALTAGDVKNAFRELAQQAEDGLVTIARSWWKTHFDWNETKTRLALGELERRGLIDRLYERAESQTFSLLNREFPAETFRLIAEDLKRQREERFRRLDEMMVYCRTANCRRRLMLDYFGDSETVDHTFCCDNCDNPQEEKAVEVRPAKGERVNFPKDFSPRDVHHVLQALDALWPQVGKAKLNQLLRGANSKGLEKFRTSACPLFGAFRGASVASVDKFLEQLIEQGLLHQADEEDYYVCSVTIAGREAWQLKSEIEILLPGQPRGVTSLSNGSSPSNDKVFEKLKSWRRTQAFTESVPPYCVLGDRTLQEISQMLPRDEVELRAITGIGDTKLQKYGAALLGVLKGVSAPVVARQEPLTPGPSPNSLRGRGVTERIGSEFSNREEAYDATSLLPRSELGEGVRESTTDTFLLLQEGLSIEEIARARGVKNSAVWAELEKLLSDGLLEGEALEVLIPEGLRRRVEDALTAAPPGAGLRSIADALNNEVDYGLIRCVAAVRQPTGERASGNPG
jgi:ATP-dependent DNA helicase RecQ